MGSHRNGPASSLRSAPKVEHHSVVEARDALIVKVRAYRDAEAAFCDDDSNENMDRQLAAEREMFAALEQYDRKRSA